MKALKYLLFVAALTLLAVVLQYLKTPSATSVQACNLSGEVIKVTDGDSIELKDKDGTVHRIRLAGIDAPEYNQSYGRAAKQQLSDLIFKQTLCIEWHKEDRYKRLVSIIWHQSQDINLKMLEAGLAWHYKYYEDEQSPADRERYALAEQQAKAAKQGLWAGNKNIAPWDWRKGQR